MSDSLLVGGVLLLYGDVGDPWGWGDGFTPEQVAAALAEHGPGPVTARLNSGGGRAFDGLAIYSLLKSHDGEVTIQVDGIAASAASLIAMAGTLEMRDGAMLMIHDAAAVTFGNAAEHERQADTLDKLSAQYAGVYARKCGKPVDHCRALMQAETWFSASEAIAEGLATRPSAGSAHSSMGHRRSIARRPAVPAPARLPREMRGRMRREAPRVCA